MSDIEWSKQLRDNIRLLERKLGMLNDSEMSCCKVTLAQCHAIVEIGRAGSITLVDLANLLNLDNSTMSRTVNNLVIREYVDREQDPNDRRYIVIKLTENGKALFEEIESSMDEKFVNICSCIPESKRNQVMESLLLLNEAFKSGCC